MYRITAHWYFPSSASNPKVRYTGQKTLNIVLAEDSETLDEVVVEVTVPKKKGEITSSVTSVKASDFNKAPVVNPMQLVEGRVAGLTVSRGSTDPNGEVKKYRCVVPHL